jgi:hypothetical protein
MSSLSPALPSIDLRFSIGRSHDRKKTLFSIVGVGSMPSVGLWNPGSYCRSCSSRSHRKPAHTQAGRVSKPPAYQLSRIIGERMRHDPFFLVFSRKAYPCLDRCECLSKPALRNSDAADTLIRIDDVAARHAVSAEPKLNSYLFLRKASIGATTTAFGDKMYKNNFAQVLSSTLAIWDTKRCQ